MPIHYLALHEIFPPFDPLIAIPLVVGFVGIVLTPILWFRRRPRAGRIRQPRPPILKIVAAAALIASAITGAFLTDSDALIVPLMPFLWAAVPFGALFSSFTDSEAIVMWLGSTLCWTGIGTAAWWIRGNSRGWPEAEAGQSAPVPEVAARSATDACIRCREAAAAGGGAPLSRIAHTADGPRFLYRCAKCHAYWEKDVQGMRLISVLRVRQDFPSAII